MYNTTQIIKNNKHLKRLLDTIEYDFKNPSLIVQAITHSSYANEHRKVEMRDNERLEFLGDAILDLIVSEYLFKKYENLPEGDLSKIRASIVCEASLAKMASELLVGECILLGKGEEMTGGRTRASILADTFEAIAGAIFIDGGFVAVKQFLHNTLIRQVDSLSVGDLYKDYKTLLQESLQKGSTDPIEYRVIGEEGPDHDKNFFVEVCHGQVCLGKGIGKSKKEAEQNAAKNALNKFENALN